MVKVNVAPGAADLHACLNGPVMDNDVVFKFEPISISPKLNLTLQVLDGLTWPSLPANWTGVPKIAREPAFWVHVFFFVTCEYAVSLLVNKGQPCWLEKVLVSLAWGAALACLPSAAAYSVRRIWATRLQIIISNSAMQQAASNNPSWVGQLCTGCSEAAPDGWLPCNGQAVDREAFSDLFRVIKSAYGDGDGQNTFNVPNLQGRVAVGKGGQGSGFDTIGNTGGEVSHTLTEGEMPAHSHHVNDPGHDHRVEAGGRKFKEDGGGKFAVVALGNPGNPAEGCGTGHAQGSHSNISLHGAGGGAAHNNMPPYVVMCYFIKY